MSGALEGTAQSTSLTSGHATSISAGRAATPLTPSQATSNASRAVTTLTSSASSPRASPGPAGYPARAFFEDLEPGSRCRVCVADELMQRLSDPSVPKYFDEGSEVVLFEKCSVNEYKGSEKAYNNSTARRHLVSKHGFPEKLDLSASPDTWPPVVRSFFVKCDQLGSSYGWGGWGVRKLNPVRAPTVAQQLSSRNLTNAERVVYFIADNYLSFSVADRDSLWTLVPYANRMTRKAVAATALEFARRRMNEVLSAHKGRSAHITVDIGTIWHRYVGICLHFAGEPPLVLRLVDDRSLVNKTYVRPRRLFGSDINGVHEVEDSSDDEPISDGKEAEEGQGAETDASGAVSLTGAVLKDFLVVHLEYLLERGIVVTSITTDNGSNLIKAGNSLTYSAGQVFQIRCACHVLQLVVEAMLEDEAVYGKAFRCIRSFAEECSEKKFYVEKPTKEPKLLKFPLIQATRWNSKFNFVSVFVEALSSLPFSVEWKRYREAEGLAADAVFKLYKILRRFLIATRMCEADSANMLTLLAALEIIYDDLENLSKLSENMLMKVETAYDRLISRPLTVAAYFCPVYNLTDITTRTGKRKKFVHLASLITHVWISSQVMRSSHTNQGLDTINFATPLDIFGENGDAMTPDAILDQWQKHDRQLGPDARMHKFIFPLVQMKPSEAEVERLFRRVKLTATSSRKSLHPRTVETLLHVNYFMSFVNKHTDSVAGEPPTLETLQGTPSFEGVALNKQVITKRVVLNILSRAMTKFCLTNAVDESVCLICAKAVTEKDKALHFVLNCFACRRLAHTFCANRITNANLWTCKNCTN